MEEQRAKNKQMKEKTAELQKQLEFIQGYMKIKDNLTAAVKEFPKVELNDLSNGLDRCRDHLKVEGVKLDEKKDYKAGLCDVLKENRRPYEGSSGVQAVAQQIAYIDDLLINTRKAADD